MLPALCERLGPLPVEIIEHSSEPPNPWQGYLRCLRTQTHDYDHLLVIQDDAVPSENFAAAVEQIAAANPSTPVCLFLGQQPKEAARKAARASKANVRYVTLSFRSFVPVVACLWPKAVVDDFLKWVGKGVVLPGGANPRSDDAVVGRFQALTRQEFRACVPSIVEHPGTVKSVKGSENAASRFTAYLLAADASDYRW